MLGGDSVLGKNQSTATIVSFFCLWRTNIKPNNDSKNDDMFWKNLLVYVPHHQDQNSVNGWVSIISSVDGLSYLIVAGFLQW